jgi:hypothetical protein
MQIDRLRATYHATRSALLQSAFLAGVFLRYPLTFPRALAPVWRAYVDNLRDIWSDLQPDTKREGKHHHDTNIKE